MIRGQCRWNGDRKAHLRLQSSSSGAKLSTFACVNDRGPYNRYAVGVGEIPKVVQEVPFRHPWRYQAQLCDVETYTKSRDQIRVVQPLPRCDPLIIPLVGR